MIDLSDRACLTNAEPSTSFDRRIEHHGEIEMDRRDTIVSAVPKASCDRCDHTCGVGPIDRT